MKLIFESLPSIERSTPFLGAYGILNGVTPTPPQQAQLLDIGCGTGVTLLNHAMTFPHSNCVGIDQDKRIFNICDKYQNELQCKNVSFISENLQNLTDNENLKNRFDYIIVHGLFSWVNHKVRDSILILIKHCLNDNGICYLSYNLIPQISPRLKLRELIQPEIGSINNITEAITTVKTLLSMWSVSLRESALRNECEMCLTQSDAFIELEFVSKEVHAYEKNEIISLCNEQELYYLGEAGTSTPLGRAILSNNYSKKINSTNYHFNKISCSTLITEDEFNQLRTPTGCIITITDSEQKKVINFLSEAFPVFVSIDELLNICSISSVLDLIKNYFLNPMLFPPKIINYVSKKPLISSFARWQAGFQDWVTTLRFEYVLLDDFQVCLIKLLDGSNDYNSIIDKLKNNSKWQALAVTEIDQMLHENLVFFLQSALLEG
jgi:SAM-dependent methyltransferase